MTPPNPAPRRARPGRHRVETPAHAPGERAGAAAAAHRMTADTEENPVGAAIARAGPGSLRRTERDDPHRAPSGPYIGVGVGGSMEAWRGQHRGLMRYRVSILLFVCLRQRVR
jgi:hypothetical protein